MIADPPSLDVLFRRATDVSATTVGGRLVLLNADAGSYHGLNAPGSHIWQMLAEPQSVSVVAADLQRSFNVAPEVAGEATWSFLADLAERGLIERVES